MPLISLRRPFRSRRARRLNPRFGKHRPTLIFGKRGWKRPRRSKMFSRPTRINPVLFGNPGRRARRIRRGRRSLFRLNPFRGLRRIIRRRRTARRNPSRRSYRRRYFRRNPAPKILRALTSRTVLMTGVSVGGGIMAGYLTFPVVYNMLPESVKAQRQFLGLINVGIGALMYAFLRQKLLKDAGLAIATTGVIDLIVKNVPQLGLSQLALPETSVLSQLLPSAGASFETAILPRSGEARALPARMSGSYSDPAYAMAGLGSDNPFRDIEGFGE